MNFNSFPKLDPNFDHSSSSSFSCHDFFRVDHAAGCYDHRQFLHPQRHSGDKPIPNKIDNNLKLSLWKQEDQGVQDRAVAEKTPPGKWVSSKIKTPTDHIALKITTSDQKMPYLETDGCSGNNPSSSHSSAIRVCTDCSTTKTPLWRSGPKGPKSLCNACGIRQRKARRAMAAAVGVNQATETKLQQHQEKTVIRGGQHGHSLQVKKRSKTGSLGGGWQPQPPKNINGKKKACFEDLLSNLSKKLGIHRVFPEEEKDAAILLMALSYGLVHS